MLIVRIEFWPGGDKSRALEIGRLDITNLGTTHCERWGNYAVRMFRKGSAKTVQRVAEVNNYARRSNPVWKLVRRALEALEV
jgi:hypothetical protein